MAHLHQSDLHILADFLKWRQLRVRRKEFWAGVRTDTLHRRQSTRPFAPSLGKNLYPSSTLRGLLSESHSFLRRIRFALDTQIYRRLVVVDAGLLGRNWWECQRIQNACIEDINKLSGPRPWLTLVDTESLSQAWMMGATWYARNVANPSTAVPSLEVNSSHPLSKAL